MGRRCFLAGRPVLFTLAPQRAQSNQDTTSWDNAQVLVQSLDSGQRTVVVQGGTDARYVSTGHLIYVRAGTLLAVPFDPVRLVTTGNPSPVADGIRQAANAFGGVPGAGLYGRCAIRRLARRIVCVYPAGYCGSWCARTDVGRSPRARNISAGSGSGVFVPANFSRRYTNRARHPRPGTRHLGLGPGSRNVDPTHVRSRDGVFFRCGHQTESESSTREPDRAFTGARLMEPEQPSVLLRARTTLNRRAFSRGGTHLVFHETESDVRQHHQNAQSRRETHCRPARTTHGPIYGMGTYRPTAVGWLTSRTSRVSPKFTFGPSQTFREAGGRFPRAGGTRPFWARNGRELFYLAAPEEPAVSSAGADVAMMTVPIESGPGFRAGNPIRLFSGSYFAGVSGRTYDVTPDGQRFLMIKNKATGPAATNRIIVVENWFEELKRRAPVK